MARVINEQPSFASGWHRVDALNMARNTATGVLLTDIEHTGYPLFIPGEAVMHRRVRTVNKTASLVTWSVEIAVVDRQRLPVTVSQWEARGMTAETINALVWRMADDSLPDVPEQDQQVIRRWRRVGDAVTAEIEYADALLDVQTEDPFDWHPASLFTMKYVGQEAITQAVRGGLEAFTDLCRARCKAHYERGEMLDDWYVGTIYWLDRCGNVRTRFDAGPRDYFDHSVVTGGPRGNGSWTFASLPNVGEVCPRCGVGWTLEDAHTYSWRRHGDESESGMHKACRAFEVQDWTRAEMCSVLERAGIEGTPLAVPNRYGSEDWSDPWFTLVHPQLGRLTIGWCRRVIQITWERGPDGRTVFADEGVTHGERLVHAWSYDDAVTYLVRLIGTE